MERKLTKEWEVSAFNPRTEEFVTATNRAWEHVPEIDENMFISQAPPLRINPTKRKKPTEDVERHIFYGDSHFPYQDKRKIELANLYVRETMPVSVTYVGDDLDNSLFSSFDSKQEWKGSTQQGIDEFSEQLAITRANIGDGSIIVHEGNHNFRLERMLRKYNGELLGLKRAGEALGVLTLDFLLRCKEMDVEYIKGYPTAEYWHNNDLKSFHGHKTSSSGLVAMKEIKEDTVNFVHGHTHQAGIVYRTFRNGREEKTIWGMEVGTFADPNTIPSGKHAFDNNGNTLRQSMNWQYGLGEVLVHETDYSLQVPRFIPITDEGILINDKFYRS